MTTCSPAGRLASRIGIRSVGRARSAGEPPAEQIIQGLVALLRAHDPHTAAHAERVAALAERIATAMGLPSATVALIGRAGLLHDIGKLALSAAMLERREPRGPLDEARVRRHPLVGMRLLVALGVSPLVADLVRSHHERWDGTGYPAGLAGAAIPLGARLVAVADVYDSLTHPRPGLAPLPAAAAARVLLADGGRRLDPHLVGTLLDSLCLR